MNVKMKQKNARHRARGWMVSVLVSILLLQLLPAIAFAEEAKEAVGGTLFEFEKNSHYELDEQNKMAQTKEDNTYGVFCLGGKVSAAGDKKGVSAYEVSDEELSLFYNYGDTLLQAGEDEWHLVEDKSKKLMGRKLDADIMKGAVLVETSKDHINWNPVQTICNAFSDVPIRTDSIYEATDIQLLNGCYYRVTVAYKLSRRIKEGKIWLVNPDKYETKKCAEVYEFYICPRQDEEKEVDPNQVYRLGEKVKAENFDGYFGEQLIEKGDMHYGWDLGNFFVSGYTDQVKGKKDEVVFLKNLGDKVTLWFQLNQAIDRLNGKEGLTVTADPEGYDQYFETPKMDFGRGVLIVRYTDHNNVKAEPVIYTDYLASNAVLGANTKVQLFEEGDYEVALDYELTSDEWIDKNGHYRIFFKFAVRNGNCMVYPYDTVTHDELSNSAMTENGFGLDLAKSRYLKINLKREVLTDSADGLVEDTRFNGPAKDGAEYTEEGIYTITVSNEYTGQTTEKKIYVGTNRILRAHMMTGLPIPEINNMVAKGAEIDLDGTIQMPTVIATEEPAEIIAPEVPAATPEIKEDETEETPVVQPESLEKEGFPVWGYLCLAVCAAGAGAFLFIAVKKKEAAGQMREKQTHSEGGKE